MDGGVGAPRRATNPDGGFPLGAGESEAEPTALAALALGDEAAVDWLRRGKGRTGPSRRISAPTRTIRRPGSAPSRSRRASSGTVPWTISSRRRATLVLDRRGAAGPPAVGWGWTSGTAGRADLGGALGDPRHSSLVPRIADAVAFLRDREAVGGGWNYGNRIVLDEALPPFAQTTAVADRPP